MAPTLKKLRLMKNIWLMIIINNAYLQGIIETQSEVQELPWES